MSIPKSTIATNRPTQFATSDTSVGDFITQALEGTVPTKRGSRKKPSVLKFPTEIGSDEVPHVMQFKIFWRWERKDLTDAKRAKAESETKMGISQSLLNLGNGELGVGEKLKSILALQGSSAISPIVSGKFMTELGTTDPAKIKELLEETIVNSQQQISSADTEIARGSGFSPMSELEGTQRTLALQASNLEESVKTAAGVVASGATRTTIGVGTLGASEVANAIAANSGKPPITKPVTDWVKETTEGGVAAIADVAMNLPQYDQMVSIYLPICTSINGEDTFNYEEKDMKELKGILDAGGSPIDTLVQGGSALIDTVAGDKISTAKQAFRGTVMNPRLEKMFKDKGFRSFSFSWEMYSKNQEESKMINDIIETFRYHASPSIAEQVVGTEESSAEIMLRVPAEFTVRFLSTNPDRSKSGFVDNEFIPKISRCALTSISVNRTPQGLFATFSDNSPIGVQLTLNFDEIVVNLRQDVEQGY